MTRPLPIKIHFPMFDHSCMQSKEVRMIREGLEQHNEVRLTSSARRADFIVLMQHHLESHHPQRKTFLKLKRRYRGKTVMIDFFDDSKFIFGRQSFDWCCYFKRSTVTKVHGTPRLLTYDDLPIHHMSYGALHCYFDDPSETRRTIDVACLFDAYNMEHEHNRHGRGRVLKALKQAEFPNRTVQFDRVSETGAAGRSAENALYFDTLRKTRILVTCNPSRWEGDSRLWEALACGCLVFVDRMCTPVLNPLIDGEHLCYYDLTDSGLARLLQQIHHYLENDDERKRIANNGRAYVKRHHRSVDRVQQLLDALPEPPRRTGRLAAWLGQKRN